MMSKFLLILLFVPAIMLCQNSELNQQSKGNNICIWGTVFNAEDNSPLEYVSIYISGTTIGTTTNRNGRFTLTSESEMKNLVVASMIGFQSQVFPLGNIEQDTIQLKIKLQPILYDYSEINIVAKQESEWKNRFEYFKELFLGTGKFAEDCIIQNPYKLDFVEVGNKLIAVCDEPIIIINKSLGYKLKCVINNFELDERKRIFYCVAFPQFVELIPSTKDSIEQIKQNRLEAYYGSLRHLLNVLIDPKKFEQQNNFEITYDVPEENHLWVYNMNEIVSYDKKAGYYWLCPQHGAKEEYGYNCNRIKISYRGSNGNGKSQLVALNQQGVRFNGKGFVLSPKDFILQGDMGLKRIADLLPDNWQPPR